MVERWRRWALAGRGRSSRLRSSREQLRLSVADQRAPRRTALRTSPDASPRPAAAPVRTATAARWAELADEPADSVVRALGRTRIYRQFQALGSDPRRLRVRSACSRTLDPARANGEAVRPPLSWTRAIRSHARRAPRSAAATRRAVLRRPVEDRAQCRYCSRFPPPDRALPRRRASGGSRGSRLHHSQTARR